MNNFLSLIAEKKFIIISCHQGYIPKIGKYAGYELNPYCLVKDDNNPVEKIFYVMYCRPNNITYISTNDLDKVLFSKNGVREIWNYSPYRNCIISSKNSTNKQRVMHCAIKNTKKRTYVFHFNKNIFDNRQSNLRFHRYYFTTINNLPQYFIQWYTSFYKSNKLPQHCLFVIEKEIKAKYFIIDNNHPTLLKNNITYEIASSKNNYNPKNLIEKFLQIERGLKFLNDKCDTDWTYDELIIYMME